MATRSIIRFAKREDGVSFSEHPDSFDAQFYAHWDGYPEGLGVEIAESFIEGHKIQGWEVEALDIVHGDVEYIYYIWQCHGKSEPWISIFDVNECIFVGKPQALLDKYTN